MRLMASGHDRGDIAPRLYLLPRFAIHLHLTCRILTGNPKFHPCGIFPFGWTIDAYPKTGRRIQNRYGCGFPMTSTKFLLFPRVPQRLGKFQLREFPELGNSVDTEILFTSCYPSSSHVLLNKVNRLQSHSVRIGHIFRILKSHISDR